LELYVIFEKLIIKIILLFTLDILKKSVIIKIEREVCESNYFKLGGLLQ